MLPCAHVLKQEGTVVGTIVGQETSCNSTGVHVRPWWMTTNEKRKRKVTQHQHATPKGLEVGVKFEWVFFGGVDKQYTLVFVDANELAIFLVMLMDSRYVVMQMNWPFLVTGESQ